MTKLELLQHLVKAGVKVKGGKLTAKDINKLIKSVKSNMADDFRRVTNTEKDEAELNWADKFRKKTRTDEAKLEESDEEEESDDEEPEPDDEEINAASDWTPWEDEKADQATKEHYAREYKKTNFKRGQKTRDFVDKTMMLIISVENYLDDVDECPENKDYVMVGKNGAKTMLEEAKVLRKLKNELSVLDRLYENQLIKQQ